MTHAPKPVVIFVARGDNGAWRKSKPDYRRHKAQRKDPPWPPHREIPTVDRDALRRRVEKMREETRAQVEALREAGRQFRAALRAA
jgi:hypothetical protein